MKCIWLQNSRRRSRKIGSFHKTVGMLSSPEDLLTEKDFKAILSSSLVKESVEMSKRSKICVKGSSSVPSSGGFPSKDLK